jgi:hypothetical protein
MEPRARLEQIRIAHTRDDAVLYPGGVPGACDVCWLIAQLQRRLPPEAPDGAGPVRRSGLRALIGG